LAQTKTMARSSPSWYRPAGLTRKTKAQARSLSAPLASTLLTLGSSARRRSTACRGQQPRSPSTTSLSTCMQFPWRIPRCRHGGRLCFEIDLPLLCGALPDGRAVDGILVVTVDGGLMAAGNPSTPARGLDDDGRAQLPPWLLRSSRRAGGARRRLHLRWRWVGARLAPGSSAARCSLCRKKSQSGKNVGAAATVVLNM